MYLLKKEKHILSSLDFTSSSKSVLIDKSYSQVTLSLSLKLRDSLIDVSQISDAVLSELLYSIFPGG